MPAPLVPVIDNFNRTESPLANGTNWTNFRGTIAPNTGATNGTEDVLAAAVGVRGAQWHNNFSGHQQAAVTVNELGVEWLELWLSLVATEKGYSLEWSSSAKKFVIERNHSELKTEVAGTLEAGDKLFLDYVEATGVITGWKEHAGTWTEVIKVTDPTPIKGGGSVGYAARCNTKGWKLDDFRGGAVANVGKPSSQSTPAGAAITPVVLSGTNLASIASKELPAGLSLVKVSETEWKIEGTPTTAKAVVTVTLEPKSNAISGEVGENVTFEWTVTAEGAPKLVNPGNQFGQVGVAITPFIPGNTGGSITSWKNLGHPEGISFNTATGQFSGTPTRTESAVFDSVEAKGPGGSNSVIFEWFIAEPPPPKATTKPASSVASTSATLNGEVNPEGGSTEILFEIGLTTSYGTVTPAEPIGSGHSMVPVSAGVLGLTPGTLYHFRVVGFNEGGTTKGADQTFTTAFAPPTINNPGEQRSLVGTGIAPLSLTGTGVEAGGWKFTNLPKGLAGSTAGVVTGIPTTAEAPTVTVEAKGPGGTTSITFRWAVTVPFPESVPFQQAPIILLPQRPTVEWKWFLANPIFKASNGAFERFSNIGLLSTATGRKLSLALNASESANFQLNTLDAIASYLNPITTCIVCYRNGQLKWSGPVWTIKEKVADGDNKIEVSCVGWFHLLVYRLLKTGALGFGAESPTKGAGPSGSSTALAQTYTEVEPQLIAKDLLERTNYDYPTGIVPGVFEPQGTKIKWNITYQRFQNIAQAIQQLANTENGFDFRIDPATLLMNTYYATVKPGATIFGKGKDRPNAVFGYGWGPKNLTSLERTIDGSALANQMTTIGQFVAQQFSNAASVSKYGLFEAQDSQTSIVSTTILQALAQVEVESRSDPLIIYTFSVVPVNAGKNVPQPLTDYDIGDFVYVGAKYGRMQVMSTTGKGPQPMRVFGMDIDIDESGNELVSNVQTTYQGTGTS